MCSGFRCPNLSLSQIFFGKLVVKPIPSDGSLKFSCRYRKSLAFSPAFSVVRRKASPAATIEHAMMVSGETKFDLALAAIKVLSNTETASRRGLWLADVP
jgi:hypothetical protein